MREQRPYIESDWVDETIDGIQELSEALGDSAGIMQLHFFKAQLDILDGLSRAQADIMNGLMRATQRYVDFLESRYGAGDSGGNSPSGAPDDAPSGRSSRSTSRRPRERLWPVSEAAEGESAAEDAMDQGADAAAQDQDSGRSVGPTSRSARADAGRPVVFRPVKPLAPGG